MMVYSNKIICPFCKEYPKVSIKSRFYLWLYKGFWLMLHCNYCHQYFHAKKRRKPYKIIRKDSEEFLKYNSRREIFIDE